MLKKQYLQFSGDAGEEMKDMIRREVDAAREVDRLEIRDIKETISNHQARLTVTEAERTNPWTDRTHNPDQTGTKPRT